MSDGHTIVTLPISPLPVTVASVALRIISPLMVPENWFLWPDPILGIFGFVKVDHPSVPAQPELWGLTSAAG